MMLKVRLSPHPFLNRPGVFDGSQHLSLGEQKANQTRDSVLLIFSFQVMGICDLQQKLEGTPRPQQTVTTLGRCSCLLMM